MGGEVGTPRVGSARWVEEKLRKMAEAVEAGSMEPLPAKVAADLYRAAYHQRISRAQQKRAGTLVEDFLDDDEQSPDLKLIEGEKVG